MWSFQLRNGQDSDSHLPREWSCERSVPRHEHQLPEGNPHGCRLLLNLRADEADAQLGHWHEALGWCTACRRSPRLTKDFCFHTENSDCCSNEYIFILKIFPESVRVNGLLRKMYFLLDEKWLLKLIAVSWAHNLLK